MSRAHRRAAGRRGPLLPAGASGIYDGLPVFSAWVTGIISNEQLAHPFACLSLGPENAAPVVHLTLGCQHQLTRLIEDLQNLQTRYAEFNTECEHETP